MYILIKDTLYKGQLEIHHLVYLSLWDKDSLPTRDSRPDPNVSFIQRFHCILV